ncbi:hypothetical protein [Mycoplasmoides alvi]|uniref:hypothetical protein n=1 Tax=Mycoplasmoides alvi TaxID=78580 RepID=UPI00051AFA9F|nr:hypothetical protein [Mycoplasmoides alvi]
MLDNNYQNDYWIKKNNIKIKHLKLDIKWFLDKNKVAIPPVIVWEYAYKAYVLKDSNFWFNLNLPFEDVYFNSYLISKKLNCILTNQVFYCYRMNNLNSIMYNTKNFNALDRIKIINKWFQSNDKWNIFEYAECRDYWISVYMRIILSHGSFRQILETSEKNELTHPKIEEFKFFIKKYKFRNVFMRVYIKLCLSNKFMDFNLRKIFYKIYVNIYSIKNKIIKNI